MPDAALPDTTVLTSSFWDPNVREQLVTTCTSATRPTGVEGRLIYETDTDLLLAYNGSTWVQIAATGAWTTYTPTVSQGASTDIAKTVNRSSYYRSGRLITWSFVLTLTAGGTAGSEVRVTLPVTAVSVHAVSAADGAIYDISTTTRYPGVWIGGASTTTVGFAASGASGWGIVPNLAAATGDELRGSITYEAA